MQAVLNSALPIFALILTGFICGYFGVFDRTATDNINRFAVYLALPSLMFVAMSKITPEQVHLAGSGLIAYKQFSSDTPAQGVNPGAIASSDDGPVPTSKFDNAAQFARITSSRAPTVSTN